MTDIKYPATQTVHCPTGPTNACDNRARDIKGLMSFMGTHVAATELTEPAECVNCINENTNYQQ